MPFKSLLLLLALTAESGVLLVAQTFHGAAIDRDLAEVTIPKLERLYETHRYTVSQVVEWYIARIEKYDGIYQAIETRDFAGARATAAREDAAAAGGARPSLWGVPDRHQGQYQYQRTGDYRRMGWVCHSGPWADAPERRNCRGQTACRRRGDTGEDQHARFCGRQYDAQHVVRPARATRTMSASVRAGRRAERSPQSAPTSRCSARERIPATRSECRRLRVP